MLLEEDMSRLNWQTMLRLREVISYMSKEEDKYKVLLEEDKKKLLKYYKKAIVHE